MLNKSDKHADLEQLIEEAEDKLTVPENQPKTGQIIVRLFRHWIVEHWIPHNESEQAFRERINRYEWMLRVAVGIVATFGALIAWALHVIAEVVTLLRVGAGGP